MYSRSCVRNDDATTSSWRLSINSDESECFNKSSSFPYRFSQSAFQSRDLRRSCGTLSPLDLFHSNVTFELKKQCTCKCPEVQSTSREHESPGPETVALALTTVHSMLFRERDTTQRLLIQIHETKRDLCDQPVHTTAKSEETGRSRSTHVNTTVRTPNKPCMHAHVQGVARDSHFLLQLLELFRGLSLQRLALSECFLTSRLEKPL